jgi:ketosteroid isomerase-like protein
MNALTEAFRRRDAPALTALYADDAECTIVNRNNPPSKRLILRGRSAVGAMIEEMCAREMTHALSDTMVCAGSIAFVTTCRYPDGCVVIGASIATVQGGLITRELSVDCWDE